MIGDEVLLARQWVKYKKVNMEQGCFQRSSKSVSLLRAMRFLD